MDLAGHIKDLRIDYCRASRCWQCNNLKSCLVICDSLTKRILRLLASDKLNLQRELHQLKHLVWFLKVRCLADDYYVSEPLLLNEDDVGDDDQVRVLSGATHSSRIRPTTTRAVSTETSSGFGRNVTAGSAIVETRPRTGIITGRMPSVSSRQSGRATSSYRPLTTSLTAAQTAFSRSTRPLLKYSTCNFLAKPLFEYLYNAQAVTNRCPDYRQCLEYLNLVQSTIRKETKKRERLVSRNESIESSSLIPSYDTTVDERKSLGVFWLISFGTCYFKLRMNKQAEEYFKMATTINPKFMDSYAWLVKIYLRSNQPTKVLKTCEDGLKQSKNALLYNWMSRVQSLVSDHYAANLNLKESLRHYPTNIEALANVGHFAFYSDKSEQALKCFERIQQLSVNQSGNLDEGSIIGGSSAELSNNLALCNFYCGYYNKVIPLFMKSFLKSPCKEVTSNIWYNVSFVPLNCGFINLAVACLQLALKNDSQNEEAINNLGVLKYRHIINDQMHFRNRQEMWSMVQQKSSAAADIELINAEDQSLHQASLDEAESYFSTSNQPERSRNCQLDTQPEMLYNMALIKRRRGHLLASVGYCNRYLECDANNYHIKNILREIRGLVFHDS